MVDKLTNNPRDMPLSSLKTTLSLRTIKYDGPVSQYVCQCLNVYHHYHNALACVTSIIVTSTALGRDVNV